MLSVLIHAKSVNSSKDVARFLLGIGHYLFTYELTALLLCLLFFFPHICRILRVLTVSPVQILDSSFGDVDHVLFPKPLEGFFRFFRRFLNESFPVFFFLSPVDVFFVQSCVWQLESREPVQLLKDEKQLFLLFKSIRKIKQSFNTLVRHDYLPFSQSEYVE